VIGTELPDYSLNWMMLYGHLLYFNMSQGCKFVNEHNRIVDLVKIPPC